MFGLWYLSYPWIHHSIRICIRFQISYLTENLASKLRVSPGVILQNKVNWVRNKSTSFERLVTRSLPANNHVPKLPFSLYISAIRYFFNQFIYFLRFLIYFGRSMQSTFTATHWFLKRRLKTHTGNKTPHSSQIQKMSYIKRRGLIIKTLHYILPFCVKYCSELYLLFHWIKVHNKT